MKGISGNISFLFFLGGKAGWGWGGGAGWGDGEVIDESICCGYSRTRSASNEYTQHMFLWRNEKIFSEYLYLKKTFQTFWWIEKINKKCLNRSMIPDKIFLLSTFSKNKKNKTCRIRPNYRSVSLSFFSKLLEKL